MEIWQNDFEKCHSPLPKNSQEGALLFFLTKMLILALSVAACPTATDPPIHSWHTVHLFRAAGCWSHWERCRVPKQPVYRELYTTVDTFTEQLKIIFPLSFRHILHHIYSILYLSIGDKLVCFQTHQTIQWPTCSSSSGPAQCRRAWLNALF